MAYLALDLGAGSGRAIVGTIEKGKIKLDEVHRFANEPVKMGDTLYWNLLSLYSNIKEGIRLAVVKGYKLKGIAVDTWGVDFGLIDETGRVLGNPVCYRDLRSEGLALSSESILPRKELYSYTGIQQMDINTLFQLLSLAERKDKSLSIAQQLLFMPDLVNYLLTGTMANEYTIASTSQLLNAQTRQWEENIFKEMKLPQRLMQKIVHPGEIIGTLKKEIANELGVKELKVYAVGSHDTASAIAAIPAEGQDWGFLSSGTWSLQGMLREQPVLSEEAMKSDFTNEGGVDNKILFMRNITGLWLLQRLIVEWEKEELNCDYQHLLAKVAAVEPFRSIVNSDDASFTHPASMTEAIQNYCRNTEQAVPTSRGELVACVLQSLAVKYYHVQKKLDECCGDTNLQKIYVVGGGSQNEILNQYIANALDMEVVVGLTEGTAIGNIMQQAIASRELKNWAEAHQIIRNSFTFKSYYPQHGHQWKAAAERTNHLF